MKNTVLLLLVMTLFPWAAQAGTAASERAAVMARAVPLSGGTARWLREQPPAPQASGKTALFRERSCKNSSHDHA